VLRVACDVVYQESQSASWSAAPEVTSAAGTGLVTIATQTLDSAAAAAADSELTGISGGGGSESAAAAGLFNAADLQLSTAATSAFYAGCWPITDSGVLTSLPTCLSVHRRHVGVLCRLLANHRLRCADLSTCLSVCLSRPSALQSVGWQSRIL